MEKILYAERGHPYTARAEPSHGQIRNHPLIEVYTII